jgi:hypothetical protein
MGQYFDLPFALRAKNLEMAPLEFFRSSVSEREHWPASFRECTEPEAKRQIFIEDSRFEALRRFSQSMAELGIPFLLMKGSALAYQIYPEPWLRPRLDTDVLFPSEDSNRIIEGLTSLGYQRSAGPKEIIRKQFTFTSPAVKGLFPHHFDLHTEVLNPRFFRELWSFAELEERSEVLPGSNVKTFGYEDAIALAALHRVVHHHNDESPLWLYDIHLLAKKLGEEGLHSAIERAAKGGYQKILITSLRQASELFGNALPPSVVALRVRKGEASALFLRPQRKFWHDMLLDLWIARGERWTYLAAHLFPPFELLREKYPNATQRTLPFFYLLRILSGAKRLFSRSLP